MAGIKALPPSSAHFSSANDDGLVCLELEDGSAYAGYSFGAQKSIAGELVFQTGMVGYPESLTDPSYRGQILVITFPLVGNYGVPSRETVDELLGDLPAHFESSQIHVAGLVTDSYCGEDFSHFLATSSLGTWLKEQGVPAMYGVDTRALTKKIREKGSMLGRMRLQTRLTQINGVTNGIVHDTPLENFAEIEWVNPNEKNLVAEVSVKAPKLYQPPASVATRKHPSGRAIRVLCVDVGMKYNQLRCFLKRGVEVMVCPWDHDLAKEAGDQYDGLFLSNGPGDPEVLDVTVKNIQAVMEKNRTPVFGICLGHQLLARASGASTSKMKFGNRGHNIPCTSMVTGKCHITSQNHGFAVDASTLTDGWKELFVNANDGSNEGIMHVDKPYFSVQFHPESTPGPRDTEFLFDVYFLPVNAEFVRKVIHYERPDAIYVTFGGQTALQVGIELKDEFEGLGVKVLGTPIDTIITTEDRELFARSMDSIGEKCAKSASASNVDEAMRVVKDIGFPVIVRAAYALGGLGSGFANNEAELLDLCNKAFAASPQVLIERSMKGWKEIEYEVVRDAQDNCITVCNMENFDPLGIHTGDSIVVAPSQTLSDEDYNMLRTTAVNVIRHLGVVGECNIQYALNPFSKEYCIIEVNARLSRSSALASKATGYPLAFIAAKLGLGIPLKEIKNSVTKVTCACFEPSLDYVVVKMPRWDLKKFTRVSTQLGSSMKSVGEVMSIGRSFEEAIQKAIRSIDFHNLGFNETKALMSIDDELQTPSDQRLFAIANAMHEGYSVDKIWEMTKIDKWFLRKLKGLSDFAKDMSRYTTKDIARSPNLLLQAKRLGFCDRQLAKFWDSNEIAVRRMRLEAGIRPFVKQIDTVAAEFPAFTNYLYLTYNASEHDVSFDDHGVMVLGSGVYRIGSSVEFDWCSVRAIRTLRQTGFKTVMVNYNPETVSTDYDEADKLYFENINLETILDIYQLEASSGVLGAMGGQTPNNIALPLHRAGVKILGTSPEMIDMAENRYKFSRMLDRIEVDQPTWRELTSFSEAREFCNAVNYPVLVRPSYVLSGAAMNTVYSEKDLESYLAQAAEVSREHPVFIAKDNDIKVIECNVRASRSFPFVSKVMGVDLIEMATKAIMHQPFQEYPPTSLQPDCVGVKVPQFSFSRLSGADPVLGVEMASTGEVACFGVDKYEAYLKALLSTGFKIPKANILLSIGTYKDKKELLPSIQKLQRIGYKLFATAGTADFLQEHGVQVQYLEVLGRDEDINSEFSLTQHLAKNMIDLYINLPSNNKYRRPANYMSKGYKTRRMAVDYQIPLVTNVKNAKILVEAIARHVYLDVSKRDFRLSELPPPPPVVSAKTPEMKASLPSIGQVTESPRRRGTDAVLASPIRGAGHIDELALPAAIQTSAISASVLKLLSQPSEFKNANVLSVKQYTRADLHLLFTVAQEMRLGVQRAGVLDVLRGRVLCSVFYEPSTRTSASFDAAMQRLGGRTVSVPATNSSVQKGETLQDTLRTLACYGDAIVLRHPDEKSVDIAEKYSDVPVINAGNGSKEHPTQAFLDLFTIREELGTVQGLTITFLGDLRYGRTVHSLVQLLRHYHVKVQLVAPKGLELPKDVKDQLSHMVVMHPLPRNEEVAEEVDFDQRAAYFRQVSILSLSMQGRASWIKQRKC
ncbi:Protein pyrABCN [Metarhizium anisopliae]|nr:Protein pyrABCN [Metarhizium anisopliae]